MDKLANIIESILFVSGNAVSAKDMADKLGVSEKEILKTADTLMEKYSGSSGIRLNVFNKKLQFSTNSDYAASVESVLNPIKERELSKALLEVSAIIAYKQPITRLEIEEIRGVSSDYAVTMLLKQNMIEAVGRKDCVGKPILFGTTDEFLRRFQLRDLGELPNYEDLLNRIKVLHGDESSSDLYRKDVYDPEADEELKAETAAAEAAAAEAPAEKRRRRKNAPVEGQEVMKVQEEIPLETAAAGASVTEEVTDELPDFLKGENIEIISE